MSETPIADEVAAELSEQAQVATPEVTLNDEAEADQAESGDEAAAA